MEFPTDNRTNLSKYGDAEYDDLSQETEYPVELNSIQYIILLRRVRYSFLVKFV